MAQFYTNGRSSKVLEAMYETRKHSDIVFLAGPRRIRIHAHKAVLTASLEYFDLMLSGEFKEAIRSEIIMEDIEPNILEAIIQFLYTGRVEIGNMKTAIQLWEASHLMKIADLQIHIIEYVDKNIKPDDCLKLLCLCKRFGEEDLALRLMNYAASNFSNIITTKDFQELDKDSVLEYCQAVKHKVEENDLAEAILTWLEIEDRHDMYLTEFLQILDLESIDRKDLLDEFERNYNKDNDLQLMKSAIKIGEKKNFFKTNPQTIFLTNELKNDKKGIYKYDVITKKLLEKIIVPISDPLIGIWDNKLIYFKYDLNEEMIVQIISHDVETGNKAVLTDHPVEYFVCVKLLRNILYIVFSKYFYTINLITKSQEMVQAKRFSFRDCTEIDGLMYFVVDSDKEMDRIYVNYFDDYDKSWSTHRSYPNFQWKSIIGHNGCIYFFDSRVLHAFNIDENRWIEKPLPNTGEKTMYNSPVSIENKLLYIANDKIYEYGKAKPFDKKLNDFKFTEMITF